MRRRQKLRGMSGRMHLILRGSNRTWCGRKTYGLRCTTFAREVTCKSCKKSNKTWTF